MNDKSEIRILNTLLKCTLLYNFYENRVNTYKECPEQQHLDKVIIHDAKEYVNSQISRLKGNNSQTVPDENMSTERKINILDTMRKCTLRTFFTDERVNSYKEYPEQRHLDEKFIYELRKYVSSQISQLEHEEYLKEKNDDSQTVLEKYMVAYGESNTEAFAYDVVEAFNPKYAKIKSMHKQIDLEDEPFLEEEPLLVIALSDIRGVLESQG